MEKYQEEPMDDEDDEALTKPFAYKSIIDRYYSKYYYSPNKDDPSLEPKDKLQLEEGANLDQYVFIHSNKYQILLL